jgi:hypothetical protein
VSAAVYTGQTGRSVDIRLKEHQRHIRLEYPEKSTLVEHSIDQRHRIPFHSVSILTMKTRYMDRIVEEAIEIELGLYNTKTDGGFYLCKSWKPIISSLETFGNDPGPHGDAFPYI